MSFLPSSPHLVPIIRIRMKKTAPLALVLILISVQASSKQGDSAPPSDSSQNSEADDSPMIMNNPGSIVDRLDEDSDLDGYLFRIPAIDRATKSWDELKAELERDHGLRFGISYTAYYQKASDTFGPEDDVI